MPKNILELYRAYITVANPVTRFSYRECLRGRAEGVERVILNLPRLAEGCE